MTQQALTTIQDCEDFVSGCLFMGTGGGGDVDWGMGMLRAALGDEVVDHYVHAARWEQSEYDRKVTDWEVARGFERA